MLISFCYRNTLVHKLVYILVRATCFDLLGHPQALQEGRSKSCLVFLHCGMPNAYKFLLQKYIVHKLVYIFVRATCFDLVGHPQALQEGRSKSCLVFLHCGIPNAYKFLLQKYIVHKLVYIFVRTTCFDLVGHPQALQEGSSKSCLVFLHCGIPNA